MRALGFKLGVYGKNVMGYVENASKDALPLMVHGLVNVIMSNLSVVMIIMCYLKSKL